MSYHGRHTAPKPNLAKNNQAPIAPQSPAAQVHIAQSPLARRTQPIDLTARPWLAAEVQHYGISELAMGASPSPDAKKPDTKGYDHPTQVGVEVGQTALLGVGHAPAELHTQQIRPVGVQETALLPKLQR